jgi:uncharacterized protein involved in copper resistance
VNDLSLELRLRYEIWRELGVVSLRRFAPTADLARNAGKEVRETSLVAGARFWR